MALYQLCDHAEEPEEAVCEITVIQFVDCWTNCKQLRARLQLKTPTGPVRRRCNVAALGDENVRKEHKRAREAIERDGTERILELESGR